MASDFTFSIIMGSGIIAEIKIIVHKDSLLWWGGVGEREEGVLLLGIFAA